MNNKSGQPRRRMTALASCGEAILEALQGIGLQTAL
jgi:hypothetical protein